MNHHFLNILAFIATTAVTILSFLTAFRSRLLSRGTIFVSFGILFSLEFHALAELLESLNFIKIDILVIMMPLLVTSGSILIIIGRLQMLRHVTRPLKTMTDYVNKLSPQETRTPNLPREVKGLKNELGDLACAFQKLLEILKQTTVSKSYFESILATSSDAFISIEAGGTIVEWNPAAERIFGWPRQEALGKKLTETIIPAQYREQHAKGLKHFLDTGEGKVIGKTLELSALRRDGHEFPVELTIWRTHIDQGHQFNAFIRDITERKLFERRFEAILEGAPDAIVIVNTRGEMTMVNSQTEKMFGYDRQELIGKSVGIFLPDHLKIQHDQYCRNFSEHPALRSMGTGQDMSGITKDGRKIPLEISLGPIQVAHESLVIATIRDITERKTREDELRQANKELTEQEKALRQVYDELKNTQNQLVQSEKLASIGQLAAGVAHEINNPMGFINNNMEILVQYVADYTRILKLADQLKENVLKEDPVQAKALAEEIAKTEKECNLDYILNDTNSLLQHSRKGIERIQKIVMDLRTFAREDKNEMEHAKIEEVIESILNIVHSEIKYKAKLEKDYGDTPLISCNPQRLGQVFINLIVNALHAIEGTGTIVIKTYKQGEFVCIDVQDTGKGIDEAHLNKIFDPFFTTKPVGQGTGLGLSVSHEIIKKHGGEITVRSKVGEGTTFTVKLPINQEKRKNL